LMSTSTGSVSFLYNSRGKSLNLPQMAPIHFSSLGDLIEYLTSPDVTFAIIETFVLTFWWFATPQRIFALFRKRISRSADSQFALTRAIIQMVEIHKELYEDPSLLEELNAFLKILDGKAAGDISRAISLQGSRLRGPSVRRRGLTSPAVVQPAREIDLIQMNELDVAQQLTLLDADLFSYLSPLLLVPGATGMLSPLTFSSFVSV